MSIGKMVLEAVEKMAQKDAEAAMLPISSALDATATKYFGQRGRKSYKNFIHENLGLITRVGFGPSILNINLKYDHPDIEKRPNGMCTIQEILYHAVRSGIIHNAEMPANLQFVYESKFQVENGMILLPASLVYGFIASVVVCPANTDQSVAEGYGLNIRGFQVELNKLWGKKQQLENLLDAMDTL